MPVQYSSRISGLIIVVCASFALSGCAQLGAMSRSDPATVAVYPGGAHAAGQRLSDEARVNAAHGCGLVRGPHDFHIGAINLDCFRFPEDWPEGRDVREANDSDLAQLTETVTNRVVAEVNRTAVATDSRSRPSIRPLLAYARAAAGRTDRNRLTAVLLKHSDDICTTEMGRITANQATVNSALSILTTGLTAAANIVTGDQAAAILTGGANFTSGSRDAINAHVYRNTFAFAISRAITLERRTQREAIEARYVEELDKFTVDDAIRAANLYHSQCSFYKGLELVLSSVEGRDSFNRSMRESERQLQIQALGQEIANLERALVGKAADAEPELRTQLRDLLLQRSRLVMAPVPATGSDSTNPAPAVRPAAGGS